MVKIGVRYNALADTKFFHTALFSRSQPLNFTRGKKNFDFNDISGGKRPEILLHQQDDGGRRMADERTFQLFLQVHFLFQFVVS